MLVNSGSTSTAVVEAERWTAHNYDPLPVVIAEGEGAWVWDIEGRRYLDCLAGYSALNFGHRHPALLAALQEQCNRVTLTSRAFLHDQFGPFCRELAEFCGMELVVPMNSGAEAVETAIKVARKWGYEVKGVPSGQATIVVAENNFHGRTTTIISFSTDVGARAGFGPYTPGFRIVPYDNLEALAAAIDDSTVAVLLEPIQGEAGIRVPSPGYLPGVRTLCTEREVLFIADEIQSGLGRTGETFACAHDGVVPDIYLLGKALGGGILPVSAVVSSREILGVLRPGEHGSTFGGSPLACAVARSVIGLLATGEYQQRARDLGEHLQGRLGELIGTGCVAVRGRGLWVGIDLPPSVTGHGLCQRLMSVGVLAKETHGSTIRLSPPFVITPEEIDWAVERLADVLKEATRGPVA